MRKILTIYFPVLLAAAVIAAAVYYFYVAVPHEAHEARKTAAVQQGIDAYNRSEYRRAYQLWLPEAQAGNGEAQANIAALYLSGNGVAQNFGLAYMWMRLADDNGAEDTATILHLSESRMSEEELRQAEADIARCLAENYLACH